MTKRAGYQAGVESMNKPVNFSEWQKLVAKNAELRQQLAALSDHQIAYETQAEQQLAEAEAESENLRNMLYQAREDHGYELARLKRIASEQLASRDAEVAELNELIRLIFESTPPYRDDGSCVFTDEVIEKWKGLLP